MVLMRCVLMGKKSAMGRSQSFMQGAFILTLSVTLVKIMGFLFRIPLAHIIGTVGSGVYSSAYELYNPICALATAGLPIAVSRMVSENIARKQFKDVRQIYKISLKIFTITGIIGFVAMLIGAPLYINFTKTTNGIYSIIALAPTVLFSCLMSTYRGYYEGLRNMKPTAASEVIEAMCRFFIGLGLSQLIVVVLMKEYERSSTVMGKFYSTKELARDVVGTYAAAGAILGVTIGAFAGFLFLMLRHRVKGDGITKNELYCSPEAASSSNITRSLIGIALPVGIGAIILSLGTTVDAMLVRRRLLDIMNTTPNRLLGIYNDLIKPEIVYNATVPDFLYGCLSYSSNLTQLIPAITQVFSRSALPSVAALWTTGDKKELKKSIESIIKLTTLVTIPSGLGMVALSHPLLSMIFGGHDLRSSVHIAAGILSIMGFAAIFQSTCTPILSMLQAVGRVDIPVKLLTVGTIIKILLNYALVGIPEINIQGAGIGSLACYLFVTASAMYFLYKETVVQINMVSVFVKPTLASICCALSAYFSRVIIVAFLPGRIATIAAVIIAVIVYVICLFLFRAITADDIKMVPKGKKFLKILEKNKIIR